MIFKSNIFITFLCKYFITVYTHLITTYAHSVASVEQADRRLLDIRRVYFYIYRKRENRLYFDMALYGCFCARLILTLYKMEIRFL